MKLMKIRLINWYHLENETIEVKNSTLITGDNGSGKSTILDAIIYALTTKAEFNKAANESSSRSLAGYVKYKVSLEGQTFKRDKGDVISYIGLEFYNEKLNIPLVIVVRIIARNEREVDSAWVIQKNLKLEDIGFIENNKPVKELRGMNGFELPLIKQKNEARNQIKHELGRLEETFFDLLHKTMAFKPVDKVSMFINNYMLPQKDINVVELQEGINSIKKLEDTIKQDLNKLDILEKIKDSYDDYNDKVKEKEKKEISRNYLEKTLQEVKLYDYSSKLKQINDKNENLEREISFLSKKRDELLKRTYDLDKNDKFKIYNELSEECESLKLRLEKKSSDKKVFDIELNKLKNILKKLEISYSNLIVNIDVIKDKLALKSSEIQENNSIYKIDSKTYKNDLYKTKELVRKLENNEFTYDEKVTTLKNAIIEEFERKNINSDVYVFNETIDIVDEKWRNAVEGFLGNQRFYLIVEPRYFDIASKVYDELKGRSVFGVGIVNIDKIKEKDIQENSLYNFVSTSNSMSKKYLNYLLSDVIACENVLDLKKYSKSITVDCMRYSGNVLSKIDPKVYEIPFIGKNAMKKQLEINTLKINNLEFNIKNIESSIENNNKNLEEISNIKIQIIIDNKNIEEEIINLSKEIEEKSKNIQLLNNDKDFLSIIEARNNFERERKSIEEKIEENDNVLKNNLERKGSLNDKIKYANDKLVDLSEVIQDFKKKHFAEYTILEEELSNLTTEEKINSKLSYIGKFLDNIDDKLRMTKNNIEDHQKQYLNRFESVFSVGLEFVEFYKKEYIRIKENDLEQKKDSLRNVKEKVEQQFRTDFLARLKSNIEEAESRFRKMNDSLKSLVFGEESYKFKVNAKLERESLYKMIKDETNMGDGLFSFSFEETYREEIQDLFDKISSDDQGNKNAFNDYTDYRNYLEYDIEIIKSGNKKQLFSKIHKEKSGGETQTPFYVIMAASFMQIYKDDSVKIMIMDEAFDKMDDHRIITILKFFKELQFQVILSTPPAKASLISNYVDTILGIKKIEDKGTILDFNKVYKQV